MKNYTFIMRLILILLMGGNCAQGFAQEASPDNLPAESLNFKNPFVSLLPKKEVPKKVAVTVVKPTPVVIAVPEKEVIPPSLIIRGLVWNSDRPQAIVNESVVGIGDTVENATVTAIKRTGIEILFEGKHFTVGPNEQTARSSAESFDSRQDNRLR